MRTTLLQRLIHPWRVAESVAARVTRPATDIAASDAHVEQLIRESTVGAFFRLVGAAVDRTWKGSRVASAVKIATAEGRTLDRAAVLRAVAWIVVVAATTVAGLQPLNPTRSRVVSWIVPVLCVVGGLVTLAAAAAIARAIEDRHRRP